MCAIHGIVDVKPELMMKMVKALLIIEVLTVMVYLKMIT